MTSTKTKGEKEVFDWKSPELSAERLPRREKNKSKREGRKTSKKKQTPPVESERKEQFKEPSR